MASTHSRSAHRLAFSTGILATLVIVLLTLVGGAYYPGYRHVSQFISELGATDAPHARLVNFGGFLPAGLLFVAFCWFAWRALPRATSSSIGFLGLTLFGIGYVAATFFPCEPGCRTVNPSLAQTLHNLLGLAGYITAPPSLLLLGRAARSWPGGGYLAPLGLIGAGLALGGLLLLSPEFGYAGLAQRVLEGSVLTWVVGCAVYLKGSTASRA